MKAVIQRVRQSSVSVGGEIISTIGRGLMILVGIGNDDTVLDSQFLVGKILALKLFPDEEGQDWGWKKTTAEAEAEILCISQFTLLANTKKGGSPDFHGAMAAEQSQIMYNEFLLDLRTRYSPDKIFDGKFGAMMDVSLVNSGPVTIMLDSKDVPQTQTPGKLAKMERKKDVEKNAKEKADKRRNWKGDNWKGEKKDDLAIEGSQNLEQSEAEQVANALEKVL